MDQTARISGSAWTMADVSELAGKTDFKVFTGALDGEGPNGAVKAMRIPGGAEHLTRKMLDGYGDYAKILANRRAALCEVHRRR